MSAANALRVTTTHIMSCREQVLAAYEHPSHRESVSLDACIALDALAVAIKAMADARIAIEDGTDALEGVVDQIHDMASDITAAAQARMEVPAYDPDADSHKHEGIAA